MSWNYKEIPFAAYLLHTFAVYRLLDMANLDSIRYEAALHEVLSIFRSGLSPTRGNPAQLGESNDLRKASITVRRRTCL